jgi:hypothetical protein
MYFFSICLLGWISISRAFSEPTDLLPEGSSTLFQPLQHIQPPVVYVVQPRALVAYIRVHYRVVVTSNIYWTKWLDS